MYEDVRDRCGAKVRGGKGRTCGLDKFHAGHHASVHFPCDGCGQTFRGQPHDTDREPDGGRLRYCYPCAEGLR